MLRRRALAPDIVARCGREATGRRNLARSSARVSRRRGMPPSTLTTDGMRRLHRLRPTFRETCGCCAGPAERDQRHRGPLQGVGADAVGDSQRCAMTKADPLCCRRSGDQYRLSRPSGLAHPRTDSRRQTSRSARSLDHTDPMSVARARVTFTPRRRQLPRSHPGRRRWRDVRDRPRTSATRLDAGLGTPDLALPAPRTRGLSGATPRAASTAASRSRGDRVFMVTDHAHIIALNRFTGALLWDTGRWRTGAELRRDVGAAGRRAAS